MNYLHDYLRKFTHQSIGGFVGSTFIYASKTWDISIKIHAMTNSEFIL